MYLKKKKGRKRLKIENLTSVSGKFLYSNAETREIALMIYY